MTDKMLENTYREHLEEDIIFCLARRRGIGPDAAMSLYYTSPLADMIYNGLYGIQYLSFEALTDILEQQIAASPAT